MSKFYLAGPMTGIPQFNFPAFFAAAADLRSKGLEIVSPAEMDDEEDAGAAMSSPDGAPGSGGTLIGSNGKPKTWGDFLMRDVKLIADEVDGIIFMDGWEKSRGARLEAFVGILCDSEFYLYTQGGVYEISAAEVLVEIVDATA